MAPEIVFRQPYNYRIDVWALGVLVYELLHGSAPFKGKTFKEIQRRIEKGDVQFSDSISDISKQLICKVLQANPSRRISIEDILNHPWMQKMRQIDKDEKKNDQSKPSLNIIKTNNTPKLDSNDVPKVKELQQIQKKPDHRSQSPLLGSNQKNLIEQKVDIKLNEKENINQVYQSICNVELSERKKNNTPNKTTSSISKISNDALYKLHSSNSKINQLNQGSECPQIMLTEPQFDTQKEILSSKKQQQYQNYAVTPTSNEGLKERINNYNVMDQQLHQKNNEAMKNINNNGLNFQNKSKSSTPTNSGNACLNNENPFKNLNQKDIAQITDIAKKQQEMMRMVNQQSNQSVTPSNQDKLQTVSSWNKMQQLQQQQKDQENFKIVNNFQVSTETAYSKDIDENSIKNSQKTINTSRFVNKHGSVHGNSVHQTNVSNSINNMQNTFGSKGINGQSNLQNQLFNQTDEIKLNNDISVNQSYTKTEGSSLIGNLHLAGRNQMMPQNISTSQEEPCFSLFGCLGPSHIATTQRNKEASLSSQRFQIKQGEQPFLQTQIGPANSAFSSFVQNLDSRPRINSTNTLSNNSFLVKQVPVNGSINTSHQYQTSGFNGKDQGIISDKNSFSTQRSSNSINANKLQSLPTHSYLGQQNTQLNSLQNNQFQGNYRMTSNSQQNNSFYLQQQQQQQQQHREKQPLGDKTNLPVSAIPTKQINLLDERKNLQKLQSSFQCNKDMNQPFTQSIVNTSNNNSFMNNQVITKERSLTQDCYTYQQYGNLTQNNTSQRNQLYDQSKIQQQGNNNSSFTYSRLDSSQNPVQQSYDISRSNRTGQRSRTLIFEQLNTDKTKNVIESMEQMIQFVKNALPFSNTTTNNEQSRTPVNKNDTSQQSVFTNYQFGDKQNQNDISQQANISILQNIPLQKINSVDSSHAPSNNLSINPKQINNTKQIININNLKTQRMESQNTFESQKQTQSQQQLLKINNNINNNSQGLNNNSLSFRNKQKIFDRNGNNNASSFHSNHSPLQVVPNMNNISVNNYFTQKTSPSIQSYTNIPSSSQQGKQQYVSNQNQNYFHPNDQSSFNMSSISINQRR